MILLRASRFGGLAPVERIVRQAREWLGVPYRHQGRTREGCDCLGLIVGVAAELDIARWRVPGYSGWPDGRTLEAACLQHLRTAARPGCGAVGLFWYARRGRAQHLAIFSHLDDGRLAMIHSLKTNARVVEHGVDEFWRARLLSCWSLPGVDMARDPDLSGEPPI